MVFHILWKDKTEYFGDIPKIFGKCKSFSPKLVEKPVDNVEKNAFCFPQSHVENEKHRWISNFGNRWKTKNVDFWKIKIFMMKMVVKAPSLPNENTSQNKGRGTTDRFFCQAFLFRKEKREGI